MPERQRGRDCGRPPENREQQTAMPEYYRAARFPSDRTSNRAYEGVRQALHETPCELSTYRTILLPEEQWHVLVLGRTPDAALQRSIDDGLYGGEAVVLPEEIWVAFNQRWLEQTKKGTWVERRTPRRRLW